MRGVPAPFPKVARRRPAGAGRGRRQPAAHPAQPDAVLLPDLRGRRHHAERRLRARRLPVAERGAAQVGADTRLTTFLVALGAVAVGAAVQIADGYGRPAAFVWLTVAVAAVLLAVVLPTHRTVEAVLGRALPPILVVGAGRAALGHARSGRPPGRSTPCRAGGRRSCSPRWSSWARGIAIAVGRGRRPASRGSSPCSRRTWRWGSGRSGSCRQPWPMIDVYMFQRDSVAALLAGVDPYAITFPNPYTRGPTTGRAWWSTAASPSGSSTRR